MGRFIKNSAPQCESYLIICVTVVLLLLSTVSASAGQVTLAWDPNTEPDLAGYKVHVGNATRTYTSTIDAGNVTSFTVTGLQEGLLYFFAVTAYDTTNNSSGFSNEVTFSIADTTPPVISAVSATTILSSGATIIWTTNEAADSQVEYGLTTAYGSTTPLAVSLLTAHSVVLSGLLDSTLYHYRVRSKDVAGNLAISSDFTFITLDATPPSVSINAPANGTTVSGAVTITATASDNIGVTKVQFRVDNTLLATDTAAPYSAAWDTSTVTNGPHTLTAIAWDQANNSKTSVGISVTVANEDELAIGLGSAPGKAGWLALGGNQRNAFATQLWGRVGWDAYYASNGELHAATGDLDGDGLDEVVVGFGTGGEGWIAILDDPAHGYKWLQWLKVVWPSYNAANGSVYPAVGDIDGDGRAEIVAGLGAGGGGFVEIFDDATAGYAHLGWQQVSWSQYNTTVGETHPAVADLDGDGRAEIVLGLGTGGQGFLEIRNGAPGYGHRRWLQTLTTQYNQTNGATFPAAGDVDGDGRAEIVVGLGRGGEGWLEIFDDATANHVHRDWVQVAWTEYNLAVGETHPAVGNLDGDSSAEIVIGLGRFVAGKGGWFEIVDDANAGAGYQYLAWQQIGRSTFEQDGGGTFPSIAQQRR